MGSGMKPVARRLQLAWVAFASLYKLELCVGGGGVGGGCGTCRRAEDTHG